MKLFEKFQAVGDLDGMGILVTDCGCLRYRYDGKERCWTKQDDRSINPSRYPEIASFELANAMHGRLPKKETDFLRLCPVAQYHLGDCMNLLIEDYPNYLSDWSVRFAVNRCFQNCDSVPEVYEELRKLLDTAGERFCSKKQVLDQLEELSLRLNQSEPGKIQIFDGHNGGACFWFRPVRVLDYSDTECSENVEEQEGVEISIDEDDVEKYLAVFLYRHFEADLRENRLRMYAPYGFEWYITYNYYTFAAMERVLEDIRETAEALRTGRENDFTKELELEPEEDIEAVIDFYERFDQKITDMISAAKEHDFPFLTVMGP